MAILCLSHDAFGLTTARLFTKSVLSYKCSAAESVNLVKCSTEWRRFRETTAYRWSSVKIGMLIFTLGCPMLIITSGNAADTPQLGFVRDARTSLPYSVPKNGEPAQAMAHFCVQNSEGNNERRPGKLQALTNNMHGSEISR